MSIYRFPAMVTDNNLRDQMQKILTELKEAKSAEIRYRCGGREETEKLALLMELLDIIHATETAIRIEYTEDEVEIGRQKVIEKNARRGYYKADQC